MLFLAADGRMRYEVTHIIDLAKSRAKAEGEARLVVQDCDPAVACPHMNCATRSHVRLVPVTNAIRRQEGPRQSTGVDWIPAVPPS